MQTIQIVLDDELLVAAERAQINRSALMRDALRAHLKKLKIKEMGSRYLFICLYVWLEKYFSRGDYKKSGNRISGAAVGK